MMTRQERALRNAVVILTVATLVLGGLLYWSFRTMAALKDEPADGDSSDVATAGGQAITEREWIDELRKKHGDEVLLAMLNHIVVNKEAVKLGIAVSEDEIAKELKRSMAGYDSEEQYYEEMQTELGLTRQELQEETEYRLKLQAIATADIHVSEAAIDDYLAQNPERFKPKTELQLSLIKVATYEEGQQVLDRLETGEDFAALAKEVSIDEESRKHGGSIGTVEEDDPFWPADLLTTAGQLDEGDMAGPLQLDDAYAVIRLDGRIVPPQPDEAEIREQVRQELALDQAVPLQQVESDLRAKYDTAIFIDNRLQD